MKVSNKKKGDIFEKYISSIYESLNFNVVLNRNFLGQQVDIYAEKLIPGIGLTKLIIECKYLKTGSVSNQNVYDFNNYISSIINVDKSVKGIIVTNRGFSKESKLASEGLNITLMTQNALESEIFDLKEPFIKIKTSFERQEIFNEFIPLYGNIEGINRKSVKNKNLIEEITKFNFFEWNKITFISVLADYGSGKTTLLRRLNYILAKNHLEGENKKPIYLELKNFELYKDLKSFLVNSFIKLFQREIPIETIFQRINMGDFIFLLDGFDEMSPQVDRTKRIENLLKLSPLLLSKSNSIISCRSSYFISKKELDSAIDVIVEDNQPLKIEQGKASNIDFVKRNKKQQIIYQKLVSKYTDSLQIKKESLKVGSNPVLMNIYPFNDEQIDMYLEKFEDDFKEKCNSGWKEVKSFLEGIYDISDLLKKPILLSMIKDTIIELGYNYHLKNEVFDPSSLYETYTKANLHRDYSKGISRQLLLNNERDKFAEAIALLMFQKDVLSISYNSLLKLIEDKSEIVSEIMFIKNITIEQIASDIQVCSFIQRTDNDDFKFIHKSYMEFYVARQLKRRFLKKERTALESKPIQKEILFFIGCYSFSNVKLKTKIFKIYSSKSTRKPILKRNIFLAHILSNNHHSGILANKIIVDNASLSNIIFENCKLNDITFIESELKNIIIRQKSVFVINLDNVTFSNISIADSTLSFSKELMDGCDYNNLRSINSKIIFSSIYTTNIKRGFYYNTNIDINSGSVQIRNSLIKKSVLNICNGGLDINNSHLYKTKIIIDKNEDKNHPDRFELIKFSKSEFRDLTISFDRIVMNDCTFKYVHFDNAIIYPFVKDVIENCRFINCTGNIIANDFNEKSDFSFRDGRNKKYKLTYKIKETIEIENLTISTIKSKN